MRMWKDSLPAVFTRCLFGRRLASAYTMIWNKNRDKGGGIDVLVGTDTCGFQCFGTQLFIFVGD